MDVVDFSMDLIKLKRRLLKTSVIAEGKKEFLK